MNTCRLLLGCIFIMLAGITTAQETYPSKPIRIVVGFSPGGSTDILARLIGQRLSETLGQPVIVENRPGAGGSLAAATVAKAPADGYTLFLASTSHTINATFYQNLTYDTAASFAGIAPIAVVPFVMVSSPASGAKTLKALIDQARLDPGKLNFGSAGNGTASHLAGEVFKSMAGVNLVHVPYKGPAEQAQDVLAGRIEMALLPANAAKPFIDSGKMVALAVTTSKRSAAIDAPTVAESGVAGFEFTPWFGLLAPVGTPRPVIDRLNAQVAAAIASPDIRAKLLAQGAEPMTLKPAEFDSLVRSEVSRFAKIFKDVGITRQ